MPRQHSDKVLFIAQLRFNLGLGAVWILSRAISPDPVAGEFTLFHRRKERNDSIFFLNPPDIDSGMEIGTGALHTPLNRSALFRRTFTVIIIWINKAVFCARVWVVCGRRNWIVHRILTDNGELPRYLPLLTYHRHLLAELRSSSLEVMQCSTTDSGQCC